MRYLFKSAVHLFLLKNNEVLLLRRYNTGYMDGYYSVIAGHLEGDETTTEAMLRETQEEAGITISEDNLEIVGVMHRKSSYESIDFFFVCKNWEGEPKNLEPDKCDDLTWYEVDNLPKNTIPYVQRGLLNYFTHNWFDTFGFEQ